MEVQDIQTKFKADLLALLAGYRVVITEDFHTPHQEASYRLQAFDDDHCGLLIDVAINGLLARETLNPVSAEAD